MTVLDDHPALAVIVFAVVGLLMMFGSIRAGTERAPFIGGPQVVGVVVELERAGVMPRRHHAVVRWDYPAGVTHSTTVQLYKREFERLQKGGTIELVLAPHDSGQAMSAYRVLEGDSVIRIGPLTSTTFMFAGLAIFLFGLFYPALPRLERPGSKSAPR